MFSLSSFNQFFAFRTFCQSLRKTFWPIFAIFSFAFLEGTGLFLPVLKLAPPFLNHLKNTVDGIFSSLTGLRSMPSFPPSRLCRACPLVPARSVSFQFPTAWAGRGRPYLYDRRARARGRVRRAGNMQQFQSLKVRLATTVWPKNAMFPGLYAGRGCAAGEMGRMGRGFWTAKIRARAKTSTHYICTHIAPLQNFGSLRYIV